MAFVDTNLILRWLLGDSPQLSAAAEKIVNSAEAHSLIVTDIIVAEVFYVLRGMGYDRQHIAEALLLVGRTETFKYENDELVQKVIELIVGVSLDFADCYLLARSHREHQLLHTFDKALARAAERG